MIVGIIPLVGETNLKTIQQHGNPVVELPIALQSLLQHPWVSKASTSFSIFALVTSLLGTSLSLFDFLADGLHVKKNLKGKLMLVVIAFLPPLLLSLFYPNGFVMILSLAGIFASILLGILPAMMVWGERFRLKTTSPLTVFGGKPLLVLTIVFFLFVIGVELFNEWEAWSRWV
jgi:tyrosine-specific transport protein